MRILGVDYGRSKIGLAVGDTNSKLADPLKVFKYKTPKEALEKVGQVVNDEEIHKIVVGVSAGQVAEESKEFGSKLKVNLGIEVVFQDETLTTQDAQQFAIEAGIKRSKRHNMEDAYSAALILQTWLDS